MVNKYFEKVDFIFSSENRENDNQKWYYIVPGISLGVILLVIVILIAKRCLRRKKQSDESSIYTIPISEQTSVDNIYQHVYRNQKNPIYLVPFSALPENFDFSRPDIIVRGDYIIIKDLLILEQPVLRPPSVPTTPTIPSIPTYLEEYQKQEPYNPRFY